jgi:hypothetical protein
MGEHPITEPAAGRFAERMPPEIANES